ncbi:hypothetical protein R6Q57_012081 [Mikania cordata]
MLYNSHIWVWVKVPVPLQLDSVKSILVFIDSLAAEKSKNKLINAIGQVVCWSIWIARNNKVFHRYTISWQKIVEEIKEASYLWIKCRSKSPTLSWEEWKFGRCF